MVLTVQAILALHIHPVSHSRQLFRLGEVNRLKPLNLTSCFWPLPQKNGDTAI